MRPVPCVERRFASADELCGFLLESGRWQRFPVLFRGHGLGDLLGTHDEILAGFRGLKGLGQHPRVYVDGTRLAPADGHPCTASDSSLEAYLERLSGEYESSNVAVVADFFERSHPRIWFRHSAFLSGLYRAVGFPVGTASANVFVGSYDRTPFGFHKDRTDSFLYSLAGRKRFLIWNFDDVAKHLPLPADARHENIRYEKYDYTRLHSIAMVADTQPGDLLYWPWDAFHIGEPSPGELTVSVAIGIEPFGSPFWGVEPVAERGSYAMRTEPFGDGAQPDLVAGRVEAMSRAIEDRAVRDALREELLLRRTRLAFANPPPPAPVPELTDETWLRPPLPGLVAWQSADGRVVVSANGYSFSADEDPALLELIEEINRGEAVQVKALRERFCGDGLLDEEDLDDLLGCFVSFRALELAGPARQQEGRRRPTLPDDLFRRSGWFPVELAADGRSVLLAPIRDEEHRRVEGFQREAYRFPLEALFELHAARPPAPRLKRYVFTAGYSGSTLLCRCIDAVPGCFSITEPQVLTAWSLRYGALEGEARRKWLEVLDLMLVLLFRSASPGAIPIVKAGPHVQEVAEEILQRGGDSLGVHLYTRLPAFLCSTLKSEHRRKDLRAVASAPQRAAMVRRIGGPEVAVDALSDARAIAYAWVTDLLLYRWLRKGSVGVGLRALDFDRLLEEPGRGLAAVAEHLKVDLPAAAANAIAGSDVLSQHAKHGVGKPFDRQARLAQLAREQEVFEAEIADAAAWARDLLGGELPEGLGDELLGETGRSGG